MKTTVLFIAMMFIGLISANATRTNFVTVGEKFDKTARYRYAEPIMFVERGVEFLIFPDGSIDFNATPTYSFDHSNYDNRQNLTRRRSISTNSHARENKSNDHYFTPQRNEVLLVQLDHYGNVRQIGNINLDYDRTGKIKRIGNIYMNYNRAGLITQVGELRLKYNHWGEIVHSSGAVNPYNSQYNCNMGHGHGNKYNFKSNTKDSYHYKKGKHIKK